MGGTLLWLECLLGFESIMVKFKAEGGISRGETLRGNSAGRAPSLRIIPFAFALQLRKKHGKPSVRVIEKCQLDTIQSVDMAALRVAKTSCLSRFPSFRGPGSTLGQRKCLRTA